MLIRYASDIHLEHVYNLREKTSLDIIPEFDVDKESVLVLAGDVSNGRFGQSFIREVCDRFLYVIVVMGNHEYYGKDIQSAVRKYRKSLKDCHNFILLDDESFSLPEHNVKFVGCTLWTDFNHSKEVMNLAEIKMNDFRWIKNSINGRYGRKLTPFDMLQLHDKSLKYLVSELKEESEITTIVISHHLPSYACVHLKYLSDPLSPAYASDLNWLFNKYKIDYWIHGHTHERVNIPINNAKVLCDPNGYGHDNYDFTGTSFIEV